ncbi:PAS domain-containing methyl-accepting chemotaxis protein [Pseudomonas sp. PDM14]|uniref:methyl-accepting chemotaxis protein n=1 Tax=Pseudomonas sp. PDM14 TaxID=2769288 RepID=UPI00177A7A8F|nr:PAS domain-containing methyl-accepting chemotaxis protein [Pseudomonas sp. PDM14]MBD9483428.1 PAS domain-containing methyl-accepting chemotaxis protein [Pseudomonas sp. PDM14]
MFRSRLKQELATSQETLSSIRAEQNAIDQSLAIIEFDPQGRVLTANRNFLDVLGYSLEEIRGQSHRQLCSSEYAKSAEYQTFWQRLGRGEAITGKFPRQDKQGRTVWLEASYNPVLDASGRVTKVTKLASDITQAVEQDHERGSIINALQRSMAIIEFNLAGEILTANQNFSAVMGYSLAEIKGKHHRIFCTREESQSAAYQAFWQRLNRGEFIADQFKRVGRNGQTIWLSATYNPVFDHDQRLCKVIKFANDITEQVLRQEAESRAAKMAYDISRQTDAIAQRGASVVQEAAAVMGKVASEVSTAVASIEALSQQSQSISNIVNTISGIAEQTNLLALNAAIEAARAGEQGRGFAVVADEVRNLAARTSQATVEIVDVVRRNHELAQAAVMQMASSSAETAQGVSLANQAGAVILEIQDGAQQVVSAIGQFASRLEQV